MRRDGALCAVAFVEAKDHFDVPVKAVAVGDVLGVVQVVLGIFNEGGVGFCDLFVEIKTAGGKFTDGEGIVAYIVASPRF